MKSSLKLAGVLLFALTASLDAQTIPVPSQLATAHTIFLAPAGGFLIPNNEDYISMVYVSTYQMLKSVGTYQMSAKAGEADLAVEVSLTNADDTTQTAYLRLAFLDAKSRTLLWTIESPISGVGLLNQKNLDIAESRAADDLRSLISGSIPISPAAKKKQSH